MIDLKEKLNEYYEIKIKENEERIKQFNKLKDFYETSSKQTELTSILLDDVKKYLQYLKENDTQTNRRGLIRSVFSLIEGSFSLMRSELYEIELIKKIPFLTLEELILLKEISVFTDKKGLPKSKPNYMRLRESIKFSVYCFCKVNKIDYEIDTQSNEWDCLIKSNKVRDNITHPKKVEDLEISDIDVERVIMTYLYICKMMFDLMFKKLQNIKNGNLLSL